MTRRPATAAVRDGSARSGDEGLLAARLAHDLRAPLDLAAGFLELLERHHQGALPPPAQAWLREARAATQRGQAMVRGLLELTRTGTPAMAEVPLDGALSDALADLAPALAEHRAQVIAAPLPVVRGDRAMLGQVFLNLVGNAVKFRGARPPVIEVRAARGADGWTVAVQDNGRGIDLALAARLFEPFQRFHGDEVPGTGLGLALCRRLVEAHGGRIWCESDGPGQGATFRFTLPAIPAEPR